jgi:alpha-glucosidase
MLRLFFALLCGFVVITQPAPAAETHTITAHSPDKTIAVVFQLQDGLPTYHVTRNGQPVVAPSQLGFRLRQGPALDRDFAIASLDTKYVDQTWTQPWGEAREIRDHHHELRIELEQASGDPRRLNIIFRVFDDGVGFRYVIPEQPGLNASRSTTRSPSSP